MLQMRRLQPTAVKQLSPPPRSPSNACGPGPHPPIPSLLAELAAWAGHRPFFLFSQVIYLRRFKDLRTLSLAGNPVAEQDDYKMFVCAYLPDLVYLDFRRIDDHTASVSLGVSRPCVGPRAS